MLAGDDIPRDSVCEVVEFDATRPFAIEQLGARLKELLSGPADIENRKGLLATVVVSSASAPQLASLGPLEIGSASALLRHLLLDDVTGLVALVQETLPLLRESFGLRKQLRRTPLLAPRIVVVPATAAYCGDGGGAVYQGAAAAAAAASRSVCETLQLELRDEGVHVCVAEARREAYACRFGKTLFNVVLPVAPCHPHQLHADPRYRDPLIHRGGNHIQRADPWRRVVGSGTQKRAQRHTDAMRQRRRVFDRGLQAPRSRCG